MPSQVPQEQASFFPLVLVLTALKWKVFEQVHFMWVVPIAFFFGVVVPLFRWGLSRPNNRLTHVPIASNSDCSAGVPLRADREVSGDSTQVPTSPVVLTNQPWVAPVVPCKAQACEYPGMLFSTRPVAQVSYHGNMSALEGDAVINSSPAVDLFKPSKQATSTRSPPKLLQGMAMHKAMQRVYELPAPKSTTTPAAPLASSSSQPASVPKASASVYPSLATALASSASTSSASSSSFASLDELCEALSMLDIYEPDTEIPDAVPGTPEQPQEIVEDEGTDTPEEQVQELEDITMASPLPSPPSLSLPLPPSPPPPHQQEPPILYTQAMAPPQEPPILYTQVMPPPPIIHPEATPEVVVAAVVAAASSAPAASAIPVASSTGSRINAQSRLQFRRPTFRPRTRLRWQRPSGEPPPPLPRPPSPPRPPPLIPPPPPSSSSPTPTSPSLLLSLSSSASALVSSSSSSSSSALPPPSSPLPTSFLAFLLSPTIPPSYLPSSSPPPLPPLPPPLSSSSSLPASSAAEQPAPPSSILNEYAAEADANTGGDDILQEIMGDNFDPFDVVAFE